MRRVRGCRKWTIAAVLPVLVSACAGLPRDASLPVSDPYEEMNRQVLAANQEVLRPIAQGMKAVIPSPVQDRLHDLNSNLKEPRIFVNNLLQGRLEAAAHTGARFFVNSTVGIGGMFDVASQQGLPQQSGDFGQTLFVWGASEGPYVVRPYLGPGTMRDAVGSTVDMFSNPIGWMIGTQIAVTVGTTGLDAADRLGQLKMAEDASIDFYSFIRSGYYQTRRAELRQSIGLPEVVDSPVIADLYDDPGDTSAPATASASGAPKASAAREASASAEKPHR